MNFSERLNYYIAEVGCSAKQLADASTLSAAAISRYRSGERAPDPDGSNLRLLSEGIALLSSGRLTADGVQEDLAVCISGIAVDYDTFLGNLKALASALSIGNNELARALSFDPSYISRIMAGRAPPPRGCRLATPSWRAPWASPRPISRASGRAGAVPPICRRSCKVLQAM